MSRRWNSLRSTRKIAAPALGSVAKPLASRYKAISTWGVAARCGRVVRQHTWASAHGVRGLGAWRDQRQDLRQRAAEASAVVCGPLGLESPDGILPRLDFDRGNRRDGRSYAVAGLDAGRTLPQAVANSRRCA